MKTYENIDAYINVFPDEKQAVLLEMRAIIKGAAPMAQEAISYGMPTFKLNGNLVHFGMATNHLGLYPGPSAVKKFFKELQEYKTSKGAIQFPLDRPLPKQMISNIVEFRVSEQNNVLKKASARPRNAIKL